MSKTPESRSTPASLDDTPPTSSLWPVETDIYILPDGRVVIADLPAELADLAAGLGVSDDCYDPDLPGTALDRA